MTTTEPAGSLSNLFAQMIELGRRTASRNAKLGLIAIAPGLVIMLLGWFVSQETPSAAEPDMPEAATTISAFWTVALMGVGFVIVLIGDLWCTLAAIHIAERERAGEAVSVGDALAYAGKRFWNGIAVVLIEGIVLGGYTVVAAVILLIIAVPSITLTEGVSSGVVVKFLVIGIIGLAIFLPVIYLLVVWALSFNAVVIERCGPIDALNHSKTAVKGAWWKVLFFSIVALLSYGLLSTAVTEILKLVGVFPGTPVIAAMDPENFSITDFLRYGGKSIDELFSMALNYFLAMLIVPVYSTVLYMWRKDVMNQKPVEAVQNTEPGQFQLPESENNEL